MSSAAGRVIRFGVRLNLDQSFDTPRVPEFVVPLTIDRQVAGQCPQCPGDFFAVVDFHLRVAQHLFDGNLPINTCLESVVRWQFGHRQNGQELVGVAFKRVRFGERVESTAIGRMLDDGQTVVCASLGQPLKRTDLLFVDLDQEIFPQGQQTMHDLPRSMHVRGEIPPGGDGNGVVHQLQQLVRLLVHRARRIIAVAGVSIGSVHSGQIRRRTHQNCQQAAGQFR